MWFCPTLHIKGMGEEDKNLPIKTVFQEMVSGLALQFYTEFMTSRIVIEDMIHPHPVLAQKIVLGENVFLALQLSRIKCILLTSSLFLAMQGRTFLRFQARSISLQCFCNYGKIGQKRDQESSPFLAQKKNLTITAVVSIIILHKAALFQLYCPLLGTIPATFYLPFYALISSAHYHHPNFYAAFTLCKKGKLMNAH